MSTIQFNLKSFIKHFNNYCRQTSQNWWLQLTLLYYLNRTFKKQIKATTWLFNSLRHS
uniref:Uncharacterized protein n=1 Tax=Nephromyces sp. ex Molgula occidentalis TaxID=2544991 RepID=A0A5C1H9N9_9APIC|nr:hypothetical protein [Nephromyces sp. ex Molgula occidentalis]